MVKGNYVDGFNHTEETNVDVYKKVHNSFFRFSAASLSFKSGCEFLRYASGLNIEMLSLSSSFVGLVDCSSRTVLYWSVGQRKGISQIPSCLLEMGGV